MTDENPAVQPDVEAVKTSMRGATEELKNEYWKLLIEQFGGPTEQMRALFDSLCEKADAQVQAAFGRLDAMMADYLEAERKHREMGEHARQIAEACAAGDLNQVLNLQEGFRTRFTTAASQN